MELFPYLQTILGTNKKNPVFSVSQHTETKQYHVYYGMELFEVVPPDQEDTRFKLMVGHLANVGVSRSALHDAFGVDSRTIKKWANGLKSGDAETLTRALAGRQAGRKLTPVVEHYVRLRFPSIYRVNRRSYSRAVRRELEEFFDLEISAETLRPLLGELKAECADGPQDHDTGQDTDDEDDDEDGNEDEDGGTDRDEEAVAAPCALPPEGDEDQAAESCAGPESAVQSAAEARDGEDEAENQDVRTMDTPLESTSSDWQSAPGDRKQYASFCATSLWCSHLGLLFFSEGLNALHYALGPRGLPVCQWLSQVLCGAANLEQSKLVSTGDLGLLLGGGLLGNPDHQRGKLGELAQDSELPAEILRWNYQRLGGEELTDFFCDPHTKHYTGGQNVLKGWCAKIRWADKVMHGDYVHSMKGQPLYLENTDNYEDMRKRFMKLVERFRQTLGVESERELTWIVDRGIFSLEIFEWILSQPCLHLITWEKGYQRGSWPEGKAAQGSMSMERPRNHSTDVRHYHFEWIEEPWPKNPRIRRLIVRATNPKEKQIEVSILCDDPARPAESIVWPMFDRWVQENDFKYLEAHFGINQITSYRSESYEQLADKLEDRQMKNACYTVLEDQCSEERKYLGKLLVRQRLAAREERRRAKAITELGALPDPSAQQRQKLGRLKSGQTSAQRARLARENKIEQSHERLDGLHAKLENTDREVSRLETLISRDTVRLCGEKKYLMDVIKITARNLFYELLAPFKKAYDNYRDDHVWFRQLAQSAGLIEPAAEGAQGPIRCHLIGTADYPKPVRKVAGQILAEFNAAKPQWPDGSGREFVLLLGSKDAIQLAPSNPCFTPEN